VVVQTVSNTAYPLGPKSGVALPALPNRRRRQCLRWTIHWIKFPFTLNVAGREDGLSDVVAVANSTATLRCVFDDVKVWRFTRHMADIPQVIYFHKQIELEDKSAKYALQRNNIAIFNPDKRMSDNKGAKYILQRDNTVLTVSSVSFADAGTYVGYSRQDICVIQLTVVGQLSCLHFVSFHIEIV